MLEPKQFRVTTITRLFDSISELVKKPIEVNFKPTIIPDNLSQWTGEDVDVGSEPIIYQRKYYDSYRFYIELRQAWIENQYFQYNQRKKIGPCIIAPLNFWSPTLNRNDHKKCKVAAVLSLDCKYKMDPYFYFKILI